MNIKSQSVNAQEAMKDIGIYLKQGYHRFGIIPNYLEGHDRIFLRKKL